MQKSPRGIRVSGHPGKEWVSPKQAIKWLKQKRAEYVDAGSIRMIADVRHLSLRSIEDQKPLMLRTSPTPIDVRKLSVEEDDTFHNLRTFCRYPQDVERFCKAA